MTVHFKRGDALEAEKITVRARKFGTIFIEHGSGAHRTRRTTLTGSAYCVIEKPLRVVRESKRP